MPVALLPVVPWPIAGGFALFTLGVIAFALVAIHRANRNPRTLFAIGATMLLYLTVTGALALNGFYADFTAVPPHFALNVVPAIGAVLLVMALPGARRFLQAIPETQVIAFQAFRIGAEIALLLLHHQGIVPRSMTFEGSNYDILTGLTAIPVAYLLHRQRFPRRAAVVWNLAGLVLLANIVRIAVLAAPGPLHQASGDLPNLMIALFPFVYLPYLLVPFALLGHLLSLSQLTRQKADR